MIEFVGKVRRIRWGESGLFFQTFDGLVPYFDFDGAVDKTVVAGDG